MEPSDVKKNIENLIDENSNLSINQIKSNLSKLSSPEKAHALESSPPIQRKFLFSLIDSHEEGEVLIELGEEIQQELLSNLPSEEISEIVKQLDLDEIISILEDLPEERIKRVLSRLSLNDRKRIKKSLDYPEDTAGRLLNNDVISVEPNDTLDIVLRYLRKQNEMPENTDKIFIVDSSNKYIGELKINKIITSNPNKLVKDVMDKNSETILADENYKNVSKLFERNDLISAAVINEQKELLGRITIDDVVDIIKDEADQNFLGMAGIAEDTFAPPGRAAKNRVFWLSLNLLTAFVASFTINAFQEVIDKIVYVAVLMPIVASMGGVAATQTLTIMIRGLTLEQVNSSNIFWLFKRELSVSILNGLVLSICVGFVSFFWFGDLLIAYLISIALTINLILSVVAGIFVPLILRKLKQDPAIAGSVVVTTITDVFGFMTFLGLSTLFLI